MFEPAQPTPRFLWGVFLVFVAVVVADSWFRLSTFQYQTFDSAFYVQTLSKGGAHSSLLGMPLMGNHAEPICFLLLPVFWISKSATSLVVMQALLVGTMAFTARRIAVAMEFGPRAALGLALAALLSPAAGFISLHEFHPEALAAPFLLLMLEARLKRQVGLFWLWSVLALACKENIALLLAWMCAVQFVLERNRGREWQVAMNVVPGIAALTWLLAYTQWIQPALNGGRVDYGILYAHLGKNPTEIMKNVFTQPSIFFSALWRGLTGGNLVWGMLLPLLFLPVLRLRWIVIAMPVLLQHLLSFRFSEWEIHWHYAAPLLPLWWFAAAEASARLFWRDALAGYLVAAGIACQLWFGPVKAVYRTFSHAAPAWQASRVHHEFAAAVPKDAKVTASFGFLPHLAKRDEIQSAQLVLMGLETLSTMRYTPRPTNAVLVDFEDATTFSLVTGAYHPKMRTATGDIVPSSDTLFHQVLLANGPWKTLWRDSVAFMLPGEPRRANVPPGSAREIDDKTKLLAANFAPPVPGDSVLVQMTWEFAGSRDKFPWVKLWLERDGRNFFLVKGPAMPGVELGQFTESWAVRRPGYLEPGTYNASLVIYYPNSTQGQTVEDEQKTWRTFALGQIELR